MGRKNILLDGVGSSIINRSIKLVMQLGKIENTQTSTPSVPKYKKVFNTTLVLKTFLYYGMEGVMNRGSEQ